MDKQIRPQSGLQSFYYTFGTDPLFPHGIDEFVKVNAKDYAESIQKFKERYPNREGSSVINCAWIYTEKEWAKIYPEYYAGKAPADFIE